MKKLQRRLLPLLLAGVIGSPAALADIIYSIQADTAKPSPGDTGDAFDVLLTDTGSSSVNIAAFSFGVTTTDTDITFTEADVNTVVSPYIFAGDSFVQIEEFTPVISIATPVDLPALPSQSLTANDLTDDSANIAVGAGDTVDLGRVLFNVAPNAALQGFTVSFTTNPLSQFNNLSDNQGTGFNPDSATSADFTISESATVPEPAGVVLLASVFLCAGVLQWMRQRKRSARSKA